MVKFLFGIFWLTTVRVTASFQFFIKKKLTLVSSPFRYKIVRIRTLLDETFKINNICRILIKFLVWKVNICDLPRENVTNGYPFNGQKERLAS